MESKDLEPSETREAKKPQGPSELTAEEQAALQAEMDANLTTWQESEQAKQESDAMAQWEAQQSQEAEADAWYGQFE